MISNIFVHFFPDILRYNNSHAECAKVPGCYHDIYHGSVYPLKNNFPRDIFVSLLSLLKFGISYLSGSDVVIWKSSYPLSNSTNS